MRAGDREREATIRVPHDGRADGRLSTSTFEERVERALAARSATELRELTLDVKRVSRLRAWLGRGRDVSPPRVAHRLRLGDVGERPFVMGRSRRADLVVGDDTVSRRHAHVVRTAGGFVLSDLCSTNGTWIDGRRVGQVEVAPGDVVGIGELELRVVE
jgi:FHA domain/Domain of unknown function (DUF1707)